MDTFRAVILGDYIPVAGFVGLDPYAILKRAQIDPQLIDDPDARLALPSVIQVLEESAALSGRDDFGVLLAETRTFSSLGPISLLMQHVGTVRSVVEAANEFRPLLNEAFTIHMEEDADTAFIHFLAPDSYGSPQLLSHIVAVASTALMDASSSGWFPTGAHFRHTRPKWVATYERHFECPLSFEDSFDGISCPVPCLDTPLPSAEPAMEAYARGLLRMVPGAEANGTVTHRVRDAIQLMLPHGTPTLSKVSANLATPPRTLQQMLHKEGQTLEDLLRQVRMDLAIRYLSQSSQDLTLVAYNLGFASLSSFSRWFSAQFGMAPSVWRKRLAAERTGEPEPRAEAVLDAK